MKHRTHKFAAKAVAAILCAALMLTACGSKETTSNETASTETTSVESTEMTTTETTVAEPTAEPTVEPTEAPTEAPTETATAPAVEPTAAQVETTAVSTGYTYSELNQTMYAKSAVNVRDLPSTDGKKIGSLKASQESVFRSRSMSRCAGSCSWHPVPDPPAVRRPESKSESLDSDTSFPDRLHVSYRSLCVWGCCISCPAYKSGHTRN